MSMLRYLEPKQMRMWNSAQTQAKLHEMLSMMVTMLAMPAKYSDVKFEDGLASLRKRRDVLLASLLEILRLRLI